MEMKVGKHWIRHHMYINTALDTLLLKSQSNIVLKILFFNIGFFVTASILSTLFLDRLSVLMYRRQEGTKLTPKYSYCVFVDAYIPL
jgi:hypothetical protein